MRQTHWQDDRPPFQLCFMLKSSKTTKEKCLLACTKVTGHFCAGLKTGFFKINLTKWTGMPTASKWKVNHEFRRVCHIYYRHVPQKQPLFYYFKLKFLNLKHFNSLIRASNSCIFWKINYSVFIYINKISWLSMWNFFCALQKNTHILHHSYFDKSQIPNQLPTL